MGTVSCVGHMVGVPKIVLLGKVTKYGEDSVPKDTPYFLYSCPCGDCLEWLDSDESD